MSSLLSRDTDAPDEDLTAVLPASTADSAQLQQLFGAKGFSARELVALSGAHCIGSSQFTPPVVRTDPLSETLYRTPRYLQVNLSTLVSIWS